MCVVLVSGSVTATFLPSPSYAYDVGMAVGDAAFRDFEERKVAEGVGGAIAPDINCLANKRSHGLPPLPERKTIFRCRDFPYLSAVHLVFAAAPLLELFRGTA